MSTARPGGFSIGEAGEQTGLATHTLRFSEKEGLFLQPIARDVAGRRRCTAAQIEWLRIGGRLRAAGMPLPEIRRYAEAGRTPPDAARLQLQLLRDHEGRIRQQLEDLQHVLEIVEAKILDHEGALADAGSFAAHPELVDGIAGGGSPDSGSQAPPAA